MHSCVPSLVHWRLAMVVLAYAASGLPQAAASKGNDSDPTGAAPSSSETRAAHPQGEAAPPNEDGVTPEAQPNPEPSAGGSVGDDATAGENRFSGAPAPSQGHAGLEGVPETTSTSDAETAEPEVTGEVGANDAVTSTQGAGPPPVDENDPWANNYDPYVDSPEAVLHRAQIRGGSILIGSGVLLGAGALALGLSDPCSTAAGNSCDVGSRNRAAITMAVPAAVMLATGGAMLAIGLRHRKAFRASMALHPGGGVVAVAGRF